MFELFDEWRNRGQRHARTGPPDTLATAHPAPQASFGVDPLPSLEPFGVCGVCAGDRMLRTEPVSGDTVRLALVCTDCGIRTEI